MLLRRLNETLAKCTQLLDLLVLKLGVPIGQVSHCLAEPLGLVLRNRTNDSAPHDVLKHLVASLLERRRLRDLSLAPCSCLFGHVSHMLRSDY